ncbi:humps family-domain-containing protein [Melanogaster broomeanus]|nr:humps family-domain-containing protein [Melanogaster broomeanus]
MSSPHLSSYTDRAQKHKNPAARALLHLMAKKKSNLSVSVDVTRKKDFLAIVDAVGPYVCLIKTHIDILEDYDQSVIEELQTLSKKHEFLIFEDRKFADIGNTVALQYSSGIYKIASWAHITNAHAVPGPSIITGLASVGLPLERGLILLSEMSSKGALATGTYTEDAVRMARARRDFVIGFVAQHRMEGIGAGDGDDLTDEDFLILSPGVGLDTKGDAMGQQYRTPAEVVTECGCDVIIVGRGIFGTGRDIDVVEVQKQAQRYQAAGWGAYERRLSE